MTRNRLTYALPIAALLAAASVGQAVAAGDSDRYKSSESGSSYGTTQSDRADTTLPADRSATGRSAQPMSDAAITAKVKSALLSEPDFPSTQVSVETNNGIVQLSGFLGSQSEIDRAVSIAKNVDDVKGVENNLQMDSASGSGMQSPNMQSPGMQDQTR